MRVRNLVVTAGVLSLIIVSPAPARAAGPYHGCPPAFIGPVSFEELIERWPPPPDLPDPEGVLASYDHNGDRQLCVMESVPQNPVSPIDVIDNRAAT